MIRRRFLAATALLPTLARAPSVRAQGQPPLIGVMRVGSAGDEQLAPLFKRDMARLGFEENRHYRLRLLYAEGDSSRLPAMAAALVKDNPAVLLTFGNPGMEAAQGATKTIPIVGMADDLAGSGYVASMARPGGNATGVSIMGFELDPKRLEVLHEVLPQARRIGIIRDPSIRSATGVSHLQPAADKFGLELIASDAGKPDEMQQALARLQAANVEAVQFLASPFLNSQRAWFIQKLREARLPAMYEWPESVDEGGLMCYAPRIALIYRHVAALTVKVLKGAKPADLPVEQPTIFTLALNTATAKAIGLQLPEAMLLRADVIVD